MKIKSLFFLLLIFVFALGSCDSKKDEQKATSQVSKETPKAKPAEAVPPDALAKVGTGTSGLQSMRSNWSSCRPSLLNPSTAANML
jgi:hypothetical protein